MQTEARGGFSRYAGNMKRVEPAKAMKSRVDRERQSTIAKRNVTRSETRCKKERKKEISRSKTRIKERHNKKDKSKA